VMATQNPIEQEGITQENLVELILEHVPVP
jgi:hypothetical protein